jgi:hypothetical protein
VKFFLPLILAASFVPGVASAQVSVNPSALQQLAGIPLAPPAPAHETAPKTDHAAFVRRWRPAAAEMHQPRVKRPVPPVIMPAVADPARALPELPGAAPAAPPAMVPGVAKSATAAPVAPKLPAQVAPRPPATVPVVAKPAIAAPLAPKPAAPPARVEIAFAAGSATLPADAAARLAPFCKAPGPIVINARAAADPDDNSNSMRLSLARALAVRAVLSACGVASQNMLPRALGASPGGADNITEIQAGLTP